MGNRRREWLRRILDWLPAALAVLVIAGESTATMSSENTSRWLLPWWVHLFGPINAQQWAEIHHLIRKLGHLIGYGVVSACFFHGWRASLLRAPEGQLRRMWRKAALLALASTLIVASADEFHQSFLSGRTSSPVDVGIDMCGALLAQLLILTVMPRIIRREKLVAVSA
jgi:VanZ family protein